MNPATGMETVVFESRQDAIAASGPSPYMLTKYIIQFLRREFSSPEKLDNKELRTLAWSRYKDTKIDIVDIHDWRPGTTGLRPAITVKRNTFSGQRLGINNEKIGGHELDGARSFEKPYVGTHTIFAISSLPDHAEMLGMEILRLIDAFSDLIREELNLYRIDGNSIGELFEVKEHRQNYAVPVVVGSAVANRWKMIQQAPLLKSIETTLIQLLDGQTGFDE